MSEISDIDLMQFADGMLDSAAQDVIEAELARDPELRERLKAFLITGRPLAQLFEPVVKAPVPNRLRQTILLTRATPGRVVHRDVQPRLRELCARFSAHLLSGIRQPTVVAAALIGIVGAGVGAVWTLQTDSLAGPAPEAMAQALENTPSGARTRFSLAARGAVSLEPVFTFRHRDGRYCRQYELALIGAGRGFVGFACRNNRGDWQIQQDAVAVVHHDESSGAIRPASRPSVEKVEDVVGKVMVDDPLEKGREQALMQSGWRSEK